MSNNYKNCTEHMWPRMYAGGSLSSKGRLEYEQCNNCLAMRIRFATDLHIGDKWVRVTDTKVVEPTFIAENGTDID